VTYAAGRDGTGWSGSNPGLRPDPGSRWLHCGTSTDAEWWHQAAGCLVVQLQDCGMAGERRILPTRPGWEDVHMGPPAQVDLFICYPAADRAWADASHKTVALIHRRTGRNTR
jgi:hypothetical protein